MTPPILPNCKPVRSSTVSSTGSRGHAFESQIDKLIAYVQSKGFHGHKNHPRRTKDGTYLEGEPYDYEIFTPHYKCAFDAKESKAEKWQLQNAKLHQINHLKQCKNAGLDAYFLVYFYPSRQMIRFDVDQIIRSLTEGETYLTAKDGEVFDLRNKIEN
ncbi:MAG: Holliday junction resolvase RecU [Eubacterium sp.]